MRDVEGREGEMLRLQPLLGERRVLDPALCSQGRVQGDVPGV